MKQTKKAVGQLHRNTWLYTFLLELRGSSLWTNSSKWMW